MSDAALPPPSAPRRRWLWFALIASLAINALLVGVVLRGLWIARANIVMTGGTLETSLPAFVNTLPATRREQLRTANIQDNPRTIRPLRVEMRRARAEATRLFLAEPFDKQAFIAAQTRLFEAETNLRRAIHRMMPEVGERLTAAERRAYLNWRGFQMGGPMRRGGGSGMRGPNTDADEQVPQRRP